MTDETIPEPGPARDRMVAELLGWTAVGMERDHRHTECVDFGVPPGESIRRPILHYSTSPADALAALEAWKRATKGTVVITFDSLPEAVYVELHDINGSPLADANASTLPAAATAALLQTREGT